MSRTLRIHRAAILVSTASLASVLTVACSDDGGGSGTDAGTDTGADTGQDPCSSHPGTCNLDPRNPGAPFDCCPAGTQCCALCNDPETCQMAYECMDACPVTLPCNGNTTGEGLSCWYDPLNMMGTAYCVVPSSIPTSGTSECSYMCGTGVECPFDPEPYGPASLCCPEGTTCETSAFGVPYCH